MQKSPLLESDTRKAEWERSYGRGDNFVFYPHEEVIRFVSKYIRKRVSLDGFRNVESATSGRILDLGCGIGRHVKYCHEMGLDAYGIDLSEVAVKTAHEWLLASGVCDSMRRVVQGDVRSLPWRQEYFAYAISHGVLDSMPFSVARAACADLARVMMPGGLFYCDLISGDDSAHAREFFGEEVVCASHEENTIQLFFNMQLIHDLIRDLFSIKECKLIRTEDVLSGGHRSRYHLVLTRIEGMGDISQMDEQ